jgi:hypothetical protein
MLMVPASCGNVRRIEIDIGKSTYKPLNNPHVLKEMLDLFCWAYSRSANLYGVVKDSLGEVDAFRIQYRTQRKEVMGKIVKQNLHGSDAEELIMNYCQQNNIGEKDKFTAMTLADLSALHAGAIIGLGITEDQLNTWLEHRAGTTTQ